MTKNNSPPFRSHRLLRYQPSAFLLAAQLLSLVLYALYDDIPGGRTLLSAFGVVVLAMAVCK